MVEPLPINRKQGAILSSIGLDLEEVKGNARYIRVEFNEEEKSQLVLQLIVKGYLSLNDGKLSLTETGKDLARKFDVAILRED